MWDYVSHIITEISETSAYEQVCLVAAIEAIYEESYNCDKCLKKYDDEQNLRMREIKRCFTPGKNGVEKSVFSFYKCVGNYATSWAYSVIDMFMKYDKHGMLPHSGSIGEQPYKVIQLFQIIESLRDDKSKKDEKSETQSRVDRKIAAKRARDGQRSTG